MGYFFSGLGVCYSCRTVRVNHEGGGPLCFFILRVAKCVILLQRGSVDVVMVVPRAESAYFSWMRVFFVETHMGKSSQQLPHASRKYAALIVWSPDISEHGAGVWGWLAVAYVTVSVREIGVAGIFFLAWATVSV